MLICQNLTVGGATSIDGTFTSRNSATFNKNVNIAGPLNVTGDSVFQNKLNVNGRLTTNQLYVGSGNVGSIPTCASDQKLRWSGTAWTCVADNVGATAATEVDPKVGSLTNGRWCRTDGARVVCDVNVPVTCGTAQKLQWNGSSWSCVADQGITAESDPKVGAITNGKWCTGSGGKVVCTSDAPSGSTTTTTSGGANCGPNLSGNCGNNVTYSHGQTWQKTVPGSCSWSDCGWQQIYHCQCFNGSRNLTGTSNGSYCSWGCSGGDDFGDW